MFSVAVQVGGGATDFYPSPAESRSIISASYGVAPTLVVRFSDDSIDESAEIVRLLRQRMGAGEPGRGWLVGLVGWVLIGWLGCSVGAAAAHGGA